VWRAARAFLFLVPVGITAVTTIWLLSLSPFTAPVVDRTEAELRVTLERLMARHVTEDWLSPRFEAALADEDMDRLEMLAGLAAAHGVALRADQSAAYEALIAARSGYWHQTRACGRCAFDLQECETITHLAVCGVSIELTPLGDLNAVRRAGGAYLAGHEVDQLDLGLAIVGLGATTAVVVSGGSSYSVKGGASFLRMARKLGVMSAGLADYLATTLRGAVRWDRMDDLVRLRIGPGQMLDTARVAELGEMSATLMRVTNRTGLAEGMLLLRHVDGPQDAARLARVAEVQGPGTRATFEVLGKSRVFRATVRLTDLAVSALAALGLLAHRGLARSPPGAAPGAAGLTRFRCHRPCLAPQSAPEPREGHHAQVSCHPR